MQRVRLKPKQQSRRDPAYLGHWSETEKQPVCALVLAARFGVDGRCAAGSRQHHGADADD